MACNTVGCDAYQKSQEEVPVLSAHSFDRLSQSPHAQLVRGQAEAESHRRSWSKDCNKMSAAGEQTLSRGSSAATSCSRDVTIRVCLVPTQCMVHIQDEAALCSSQRCNYLGCVSVAQLPRGWALLPA
ncbi:hypothetical protein CVIRNUC_009294 [Coccomyxa viridis]|uniref:Uncharacterized protein n=1 Tax=Coccomyxa viridis TaxID=1274662 RepID=A0AAV1IHD2_9CHLO|nr:hypothetical protein CVIRNUC_009294 [Coccomyxa viridis]